MEQNNETKVGNKIVAISAPLYRVIMTRLKLIHLSVTNLWQSTMSQISTANDGVATTCH